MKHLKINSIGLLIAFTILFALTSCLKDTAGDNLAAENSLIANYIASHAITTQPTSDGLYFILQNGTTTGATPVAYDYVLYDYVAADINDKVYDTSITSIATENNITYPLLKNGGPRLMQMDPYYFPLGLIEGFSKMKEGETAKLIIPSSLWNYDYNPRVYSVFMKKVITNMQTYEHAQITSYLDSSILNKTLGLQLKDSTITSGATGVYYLEKTAGTGAAPVVGDSIHVAYKATTINGTYFDKGSDYKAILGNGHSIPGFEEGIKHMKNGGTAIIIVPYRLAYSNQYVTNSDNQIILQPFSTLVFEVTLTAVKH